MFYFTLCIFNNNRRFPDSKLSKMFSGSIPIVLDTLKQHYFIDRSVPVPELLSMSPVSSSTHHQCPRAGLQILITSGNFNSPLSFAPGPDIYICRDGAIFYNFFSRYYSRYSSVELKQYKLSTE